ncbi:hypothetical protein [Legionella fallonii]|uniref:Uncharacterized protein n=1 Tax=Legionella fallonii LLAP-10 TaxID=1212491 RepID=A0A098G0J4_9GAMM|nr:hypothetical protein [Legionella fallonii]CEG56032.1 exported protein of unknown function [Legionella fallonii LLAP-10]
MKLVHLIRQLSIGLNAFCFAAAAQAGISVWSFVPDTRFPPKASVTSTGTTTVKYTIINNSSKPHNLVISPQTGVSQNNGPCSLGSKGSTCTLTLTIIGSALPASGLSGGPVLCQTHPDGRTPNLTMCYQPSQTDSLAITIVPHNLSMLPIPIQEATANQPFVYNLKSSVKFYDENQRAGLPAQGVVNPIEQDGLRFDQASFSIAGTPTRTGIYFFTVGAQNANGSAAPVDMQIEVHVNAKDKPVFKQHYSMASALPEQRYSINLMELIEPQIGFMVTNQITFRIDPRFSHPKWLSISEEDNTRLVGKVDKYAAGKEVEVTLIASSNTGGDSDPLTIKIPIAYDPTMKPVIDAFELKKVAGTQFYKDLSEYINDPAHDSSLRVVFDKVEPEVPWLSVSSLNPTVLEGAIPPDATGQLFQLTLRATTSVGGSSDPITIPLQININKERTPRFKAANPILPMIYPGQPFFYDFVANRDIYPEYDDAPYEINFAEEYELPTWLRIEENKLIADLVPLEDIGDEVNLKVVIKNIPGGMSEIYSLDLTVMN